ncbi:MAG: molybdopterin-dependent oxidoreductase [Thermodesulfobacteriota bacterium]
MERKTIEKTLDNIYHNVVHSIKSFKLQFKNLSIERKLKNAEVKKMAISRREFLKNSAAVAGLATIGDFFFNLSDVMAKTAKDVPFAPTEDVLIPSTDVMCVNFCGIRVRRLNGVVRAIYGNPENPQNAGHLCPKGVSGIFDTYNPYRVKVPLKRTNAKKGPGEDPRWVEISWDEAFNTIAEKLKKIKSEDPKKFIWQHGHGKYLIRDQFPKAFCKAFGTPNVIHRTTVCEAARHVSDELTWGYHAFLPDIDHCTYMLNFGGNYFEAEQWARWLDRKTIEAMERGMKLVVVEPRLSNLAAKAHDWVPIRPATDVVFLLAMANELISNRYVDEEFLLTYTNAPFLVGEDGKFLRQEKKELVWDKKSNSAKPYEGDVEPALGGSYRIDGRTYRTAFEVFKEGIKEITPEYASKVCDTPVDTVKRIAREFGENAKIGATVVKDGKVLRYRPVAIHTFRGLSAHEYGVQNNRARQIVIMLVGAFDAVGGMNLHDVYKNPKYMQPAKCEYPPKRVDLQESVYFPHSTHNVAQQVALTLADPKAYGLQYEPEMMMCYATNRVFSTSDIAKQIEGYRKIFTVVIDTIITEQADMADIVLPDKSYLESWHWSDTRWNLEYKHAAIRQPIVNAYGLTHDAFDILMELAGRMGMLDKYIEGINKNWKTSLAPGKKYSSEEMVAAIAKASGTDIEYFKEHGLKKKKLSVEDVYLKGVESKFKGSGKPKMHFYCEELVHTAEKVKETVEKNNIKNIDVSDLDVVYSPLPKKEHAFPTPHKTASPQYEFYLITYKRMYLNQSNNALVPVLREIAHDSDENFVLINPLAAKKKAINEGDMVVVESRAGKTKIRAKLSEGIRPDTVAISYHYGHWSNTFPGYAKKGASPNWVLELHPDRISGMNSFNDTKVKVYKA